MSTSNMSIRIDSDVKAKAQALFSALGIDMTTAINIFLRQAIQHQGIPCNVTLTKPNQETLDAMAEVVDMKIHPEKYKGYTDVDEMMKELLS